MDNKILGLHHITAIAGKAKRNFDFYTRVMGLRLVKKTVNFDDPGTYHLYYADEKGTPGTILTFFPWEMIQRGTAGAGMATEVGLAVPAGSLSAWEDRLKKNNVIITGKGEHFGESYVGFEDPDGLKVSLIIPEIPDTREPWTTAGIHSGMATRGFHTVTLTLGNKDATAFVLTDLLGYKLAGHEKNCFRFKTDAAANGSLIDIVEDPAPRGINAGGTIHHIAFRVKDEDIQMDLRKKIVDNGFEITHKIDRNYFFSLYFREPGGVLFEIATDNPGFTVDEPLTDLGTSLRLPPQYESRRKEIEKVLPSLD